jgi:hypothetical protein
MHGVEEIGLITNDGYCFHYDLGFVTDSRRAQMHFRKVWCYREHATDFAIRIVHGWRCRFVECVFTGGTNNGAGFLDIHQTSGCYLLAVNMIGIGGAIIRCTNGNEIQLTGCRSEGARQIAAYYFKDTSELVINGATKDPLQSCCSPSRIVR